MRELITYEVIGHWGLGLLLNRGSRVLTETGFYREMHDGPSQVLASDWSQAKNVCQTATNNYQSLSSPMSCFMSPWLLLKTFLLAHELGCVQQSAVFRNLCAPGQFAEEFWPHLPEQGDSLGQVSGLTLDVNRARDGAIPVWLFGADAVAD